MNWLKKVILSVCSTEDLANELKSRHEFYLIATLKKTELSKIVGGKSDGLVEVAREAEVHWNCSMMDVDYIASRVKQKINEEIAATVTLVPDYCDL